MRAEEVVGPNEDLKEGAKTSMRNNGLEPNASKGHEQTQAARNYNDSQEMRSQSKNTRKSLKVSFEIDPSAKLNIVNKALFAT